MNIAPTPEYLRAIRNQHNLGWPTLLAELIDNAIDAGADKIVLDFSQKKAVTVKDNGKGCDSLVRMLSPGRRQSYETTCSGKYGIGAKEAMICLADQVTIDSVHNGVRRVVLVNWRTLFDEKTWDVSDPNEIPTNMPQGTSITLELLQRTLPSAWNGLKESLGATYASALCGRLVMKLIPPSKKELVVEPAGEPDLEHIMEASVEFDGNKKAHIKMGMIVNPNDRPQQGVKLSLKGGRVVRTRTRIGLGSDPTPGLYGHVELDRGFHVSKNKDALSERDEQAIANEISLRFASLIELSRKAAEDLLLADQNGILSLLPDAFKMDQGGKKNAKAQRAAPIEHPGAAEPTGRGGKHKRAARTQNGDRFQIGSAGGRTMHLQRQSRGDSPIFALEGGNTIYINTDNPIYEYFDGDISFLGPMAVMFFSFQVELQEGSKGQLKIPYPEIQQDEASKRAFGASYLLERYVDAAKLFNDRQKQPAKVAV